ncbi:Bicoid-interacting protein 3-domain-containing protein, partial [Dimargaris cristalligena]
YGNYAQYYGYRQPSQGTVDPVAALDPRIALLDPAWIRNQRVLDIGCNAGFVTSGLALHLQPWWAVGVDIDPTLIRKAKQHLHFINSLLPPSFHSTSIENISTRPAIYFPLSMPRLFGNIPPSHSAQLTPTPTLVQSPLKFPQNVFYHSLNWLHPPDPSPLPTHYDTILALSVSKWIHLHHGDFGLCQFFQKAYDQLVPGGRFVLEPQAFEGYAKRSRLTETMSHNYQSIQMRPEHFKEHLMSVVGFTS